MLPRVLHCVVCDTSIVGLPNYANDWERTRKRSPCCGEACAARFDADVHWMPDPWPSPASEGDEFRLLGVVRRRLRDGDRPGVVVREMLRAGVTPAGLRKQIVDAQLISATKQKQGRAFGFLGFLGHFISIGPNHREPRSLEAGLADIEAWETRLRERP